MFLKNPDFLNDCLCQLGYGCKLHFTFSPGSGGGPCVRKAAEEKRPLMYINITRITIMYIYIYICICIHYTHITYIYIYIHAYIACEAKRLRK